MSRNFAKAKERRATGSRISRMVRRQQLVETIRQLRADRRSQVVHALKVIVERTLCDTRRLHDAIDSDGGERPLRKRAAAASRICDRVRARRSRPISALRAKSIFAIAHLHSSLAKMSH